MEYKPGTVVIRLRTGTAGIDEPLEVEIEFYGIDIGNFFVHLKQITVPGFYHFFTKPFDGIFKIEVYGFSFSINTIAGVTSCFGSP